MKTRAVRVVLAAVVGVAAWCVAGVGAAFGAPGDLDATFGTGGLVTTQVGAGGDRGRAVAIDSQGRVVVAGWACDFCEDFAVVRYTSAGVLDTSFGTDGKVVTAIGSGPDNGQAVAIDSQDRVVVAGSSFIATNNRDFGVVRYTSAGVLDTSFSNDGKLTTAFSGGTAMDHGYAVAVDSDNRIVVAGASGLAPGGNDYDFAVVRYNSDGSLDTNFGGNWPEDDGKVTTDFGAGHDYGTAVVVDSQNRIIVAGQSDSGLDKDFAVVRYTADGSLDPSFSGDGVLRTDFDNSDDTGRAVAVDSQGRIVVAGYSDNGSDNDFAVARYTSAGVLDTSFGTDGKLTTAISAGDDDDAYGVAVDLDDRIIVTGHTWSGNSRDFAVVRYTSAGVLDTSFGSGGIVTTAIGASDDYGRAVALDSQGRVVVAGYRVFGSNINFAVARYLGASMPGAPSGVAGFAGDGVVALFWVAPSVTGGVLVTDYVVEYSSDGGATWSVFADGVSTSTFAVMTGFSNGTSYVFRVSAVNSAGTGAVSVVSAAVVPVAPVGAPAPVAPVVPVGCTITGTPGDDVLVGTSGADHICGLGGNDKIYGKGGNDILDGGSGKDKLFGGGGKDTLYGRSGADVLKGGPGNDRLYGGGGKDKLQGQAGNDKLYGGGGKDKLYGGGGKDRLYGGGGKDRLAGQGGNDRLFGQGGKDKLYGGKGKDVLVGGPKKDVLNGGKGKDKAKKPGPDVLKSIEIVVP